MKNNFRLHPSSFILLARLWLHEPDAETIARAVSALSLPAASPADLASAYADLFLLNIYPYGTLFTDGAGELNGPNAQHAAALYEAHDYRPPELNEAGAPDHLGVCLGFLAHLGEKRLEIGDFISSLLDWAPVCCLAVEREPAAHPFYRALGVITREALLSHLAASNPRYATPAPLGRGQVAGTQYVNQQSSFSVQQSDEEVRLRDVVRFFLAPARCGMFLSRSRLGQAAKALGMRLPFGSRLEVAEMLFGTAGESGQVPELSRALDVEAEQWARVYQAWSATYPAWQPFANHWLERIQAARHLLAGMRAISESPLELEYEGAAHSGRVP